ncbi:tetratricopeptide repeat protein [Methanolobus sp. ZRKC5]|uniref:tetratricopeptide repeat protein n=1 Tax=unclassified Methanolobus TaxID=2629569 RepID=UPI00313DC595
MKNQNITILFILLFGIFLTVFAGCIDKEASEVDQLIESANEQRDYGRYNTALEYYNQALDIDPSSEAAWSGKGLTYINLDKKEEATKCYDVILSNSDDVRWLRIAGMAYDISLNQPKKAIEAYDKMLEINPDDCYVWASKGSSLQHINQNEEAVKCFDMALSINSDNGIIWRNKGDSLLSLGKQNEAVECYNEAIKCYNKDLEVNPEDIFANFDKERVEEKLEEIK